MILPTPGGGVEVASGKSNNRSLCLLRLETMTSEVRTTQKSSTQWLIAFHIFIRTNVICARVYTRVVLRLNPAAM